MAVVAYLNDIDVWPLLTDLLGALTWEVGAANLPPLGLTVVVPGAEAAFDFGCDALGWVRAASVYPTATFPNPEASPLGSCVSSLAVSVEVGIMRCAPNPDTLPNGEVVLPTATDLSEAARLQLADMAAIRRAILRCPAADRVLSLYQPLGPQGGVVGGFWSATLGR